MSEELCFTQVSAMGTIEIVKKVYNGNLLGEQLCIT